MVRDTKPQSLYKLINGFFPFTDGAIITGSVDGNRIWGKDIKNANLAKVEWSPDGKTILIGTNELEIQSFDNMGNFVKKVPLATLQALYGRSNAYKEVPNLVSIRWFKNSTIDHPLIVAFEDGWLQLMKNEADDFPVLINTELKITSVEWNYAGDMFAVTGFLFLFLLFFIFESLSFYLRQWSRR